jgi:hypothetical protein
MSRLGPWLALLPLALTCACSILGAVTEPHAVRRLLAALGLAAEPPPDPVVSAA